MLKLLFVPALFLRLPVDLSGIDLQQIFAAYPEGELAFKAGSLYFSGWILQKLVAILSSNFVQGVLAQTGKTWLQWSNWNDLGRRSATFVVCSLIGALMAKTGLLTWWQVALAVIPVQAQAHLFHAAAKLAEKKTPLPMPTSDAKI